MKLSTYEDWKHCITVECGIPLTPDYIDQRIAALKDPRDHHTQKFKTEYGDAHLAKVIGWFETAKKDAVEQSLTS